jgi:hypothetical protein
VAIALVLRALAPDANALVWFVRRLRVALEDGAEMRADGVGGDVFGELLANQLLIRLVNFDDLFDAPLDIGREEVFDDARGHGLGHS